MFRMSTVRSSLTSSPPLTSQIECREVQDCDWSTFLRESGIIADADASSTLR